MTKRKTKTASAAPETLPVAEPISLGGKVTKLDQIIALLARPDGAAIDDLMAATGWQAHSVRGALAGSLRKKGHVVDSQKVDGRRIYRIGAAAQA